jgi:hypothetical protein
MRYFLIYLICYKNIKNHILQIIYFRMEIVACKLSILLPTRRAGVTPTNLALD